MSSPSHRNPACASDALMRWIGETLKALGAPLGPDDSTGLLTSIEFYSFDGYKNRMQKQGWPGVYLPGNPSDSFYICQRVMRASDQEMLGKPFGTHVWALTEMPKGLAVEVYELMDSRLGWVRKWSLDGIDGLLY